MARAEAQKQKKHDDRRQHILEAARRLFFLQSFENVSIRDIERESGYTRGAIYYYFASKEDVYFSTVLDGLREISEEVEALSRRQASAAERLLGFIHIHVRSYDEAPAMFNILFRFFFSMRPDYVFPERVLAEVDVHVRKTVAAMTRIIDDGNASGEFKCPDPGFQALALWGLSTTVIRMTDDNPRIRSVGRPRAQLLADLERYVLTGVGAATSAPGQAAEAMPVPGKAARRGRG